MSFSYDVNLSTFKDRLRLLIFDTVESTAAFSNEELAAFESIEPNIYLAAASFCEAKGLKIAEDAFEFDTASDTRGGLRVDRKNQPQWWFKRAENLRKRATDAAFNADEVIDTYDFVISPEGVDRSQYVGSTADSDWWDTL